MATKTKKETKTISVFEQAQNMNLNQAVGILAQTATIAQQNGILTVNDSVLVAKALEIVQYNEKA
tara:strand:- start:152 stop:346 length:195 start_codon:yes stop_codon:yes gene_type:complete